MTLKVEYSLYTSDFTRHSKENYEEKATACSPSKKISFQCGPRLVTYLNWLGIYNHIAEFKNMAAE